MNIYIYIYIHIYTYQPIDSIYIVYIHRSNHFFPLFVSYFDRGQKPGGDSTWTTRQGGVEKSRAAKRRSHRKNGMYHVKSREIPENHRKTIGKP